jgi:hypothetical protein
LRRRPPDTEGSCECIYSGFPFAVRKPEGKRAFDRPRRRWEYKLNIKMHLKKIVLEDMAWIDLAQDKDRWRALVNTALNLRVI